MNPLAEVIPNSTNARLLAVLQDGEWHSHADLREATGLIKTQVSAGLHRLRYYYAYEIDSQDVGTHVRVRLVGRLQIHTTPYPDLGIQLQVVGVELRGEKVLLALKGAGAKRYIVELLHEEMGNGQH